MAHKRVKVVEVTKPEQTAAAVKDAEIILAAGAGGIQLLISSRPRLQQPNAKSSADINAIKPLGVEGLGPNDDGKELKPGVCGIGALAIGKLKIKTETEMIKRATAEPSGTLRLRNRLHHRKRPNSKETRKSSCQISSSLSILFFIIVHLSRITRFIRLICSFAPSIKACHGKGRESKWLI